MAGDDVKDTQINSDKVKECFSDESFYRPIWTNPVLMLYPDLAQYFSEVIAVLIVKELHFQTRAMGC
jgi:hypothetical protein